MGHCSAGVRQALGDVGRAVKHALPGRTCELGTPPRWTISLTPAAQRGQRRAPHFGRHITVSADAADLVVHLSELGNGHGYLAAVSFVHIKRPKCVL